MNNELKIILKKSKHIVFFGGAGVSTESGIPDFRSTDGLYNRKDFKYPPETMLSNSFFRNNTEEFYDFYKNIMLAPNNGPSKVHYTLAEWERTGKLKGIITQNIDALHQQAGSKNVLELHGSIERNYCMKCNNLYGKEYILRSTGIPRCTADQGIIKPDVVLYEENLNENVLKESIKLLRNSDTLIVAGTSLTVYPAAGLLDYFSGEQIVLINRDATSRDNIATLLIRSSISEAICS